MVRSQLKVLHDSTVFRENSIAGIAVCKKIFGADPKSYGAILNDMHFFLDLHTMMRRTEDRKIFFKGTAEVVLFLTNPKCIVWKQQAKLTR